MMKKTLLLLFCFYAISVNAQDSKNSLEVTIGNSFSYLNDSRGTLNYLRGAFESNQFKPDNELFVPSIGVSYRHNLKEPFNVGLGLQYNMKTQMQHAYQNNTSPLVTGGLQSETFNYSSLKIMGMGEYVFETKDKLTPAIHFELGYNQPFISDYQYSYYRNETLEPLASSESDIKGGIALGFGPSITLNDNLTLSVYYQFSQFKFNSQVTSFTSGQDILEKHALNDHSIHLGISYHFGNSLKSDTVKHSVKNKDVNLKGFTVKAGSKMIFFTPNYVHYKVALPGSSVEQNRSWQEMSYNQASSAYFVNIDYAIKHDNFDFGFGTEINFPASLDNSFVKVAALDPYEIADHKRIIDKYSSIIPYLSCKYTFDTYLQPYLLLNIGYAFNYFEGYTVEISEDINDMTSPYAIENAINLAIAFGINITKHIGVECRYEMTNTGFQAEYNSLTASGKLAYQGDKMSGSIKSLGFAVLYRF